MEKFLQSAKTRPGADCGSGCKFLTEEFRLKLKKVGKTTRPFKYDLNQIPNDYTVEVRNFSLKNLLIFCLRLTYLKNKLMVSGEK